MFSWWSEISSRLKMSSSLCSDFLRINCSVTRNKIKLIIEKNSQIFLTFHHFSRNEKNSKYENQQSSTVSMATRCILENLKIENDSNDKVFLVNNLIPLGAVFTCTKTFSKWHKNAFIRFSNALSSVLNSKNSKRELSAQETHDTRQRCKTFLLRCFECHQGWRRHI